jgi:hypothetical protein
MLEYYEIFEHFEHFISLNDIMYYLCSCYLRNVEIIFTNLT